MAVLIDCITFRRLLEYQSTWNRVQAANRYFRDRADPFFKYSTAEFHARYGFTQDIVKNVILPLIASDLQNPSRKALPIAPEIKLLITLRYFVTGKFQKMIGNIMYNCKATVSRVIIQISKLLASKMKDFVKFPSTSLEMAKIKKSFYEVANFPEVIGCIGCTHIKIKSPSGRMSKVYRNRNGWYSIKIQMVTGPNMEFYDLVARWPGRASDNFIYNKSTLKQQFHTRELRGIILGNNQYDVRTELLTPFPCPTSPGQEAYNKSLNMTYNTMERGLHIWKTRFSCLQIGIQNNMQTIVAIISACAALHNIAILVDDPRPFYCRYNVHDDVVVKSAKEDPNSCGYSARQSFVERYFS